MNKLITLTPGQKAIEINLDNSIYGSFIEIGYDILFTKNKGPVIIEGNAKPSRWIFNVISDYLISQNQSPNYYTLY